MKLSCVILAAGMGKRMRSDLPKVLHQLYDRPMLQYVLNATLSLKPDSVIVVVGKSNGKAIEKAVEKNPKVKFAVQDNPLGTAHALQCALPHLKGSKSTVLVVNGDMPLINHKTLKKFLSIHSRKKNSLSALSFFAGGPSEYGRIVRDYNTGKAVRIVEVKEATSEECEIDEVNSGLYAIENQSLDLLKRIRKSNAGGEFYITDLFEETLKNALKADIYPIGEEGEFLGINTRSELAIAHESLRVKHITSLVAGGVNFIDLLTAFIYPSVKIGRDTTIYPNVYIHGETTIGKNCTIYPNVRIVDSKISDNVVIKDSTVIEESVVSEDAQVGPFAHLRPGTYLKESVKIGNFVELKKTVVGKGTKAMHLSYLGDAIIGEGANIGAGTITCNYDGRNKFQTVIEDGVFVGSDSQLVAPVTVRRGAYIGAGSTITREVPEFSLAVSRPKQTNIPDWVKRKITPAKNKKKG